MDNDVAQELVDAGRGYESLFVPALFEQWTQHLLSGAAVGVGSRVVDVACGTGVLARGAHAVAGSGGRVVGVDPAPGMLIAAKEIEPGIEWIQCGAEALQLNDESFDAVVSQFGMMFFEDRQQAVKEMLRVLKPGGSLAIAVWNTVENNPAYGDIISLLQEHVGTVAADALRLPYSLGDVQQVVDELESAGFANVSVDTKTETARFPSSRHMVEAELRGWLPLFDIFLDEEKIDSVLVESDRLLSKYVSESGEAVFPTSAHVITAGK